MGKITQEELDNYKENCKKGHMERIAGYSIEYYDKNEIVEDKVNHPSYYTWLKELCGIEVIDIVRHMDFDLGNVLKYVLRQGRKSEEGMSNKQKAIEDLKKARFYLDDKIKMLEKE